MSHHPSDTKKDKLDQRAEALRANLSRRKDQRKERESAPSAADLPKPVDQA